MNAPCCIIYSTILFDLDMMGRHLKLKTPNTPLPPPPPRHRTVKRPSAVGWSWVQKKEKLISMIFWIRKNKHKRLTCKNIFYDRKYLKNDNISAMYKNINIIFIYIFRIFYLLYPLKYTNEAAIGQSEELVRQHVFKYPSAVNVKTQNRESGKTKKKKKKDR